MKQTITLKDDDGNPVVYTAQTMTAGDALQIQDDTEADTGTDRHKALQRTLATVAASLRKPIEEVKALPYDHYLALVDAVLDVNGMRSTSTGEAQAGESPAA